VFHTTGVSMYYTQAQFIGTDTSAGYSRPSYESRQAAAAVVTDLLGLGWRLTCCVSQAAPAVVASVQSGVMATGRLLLPSVLRGLAERTVTHIGLGGVLLLAMPVALPVLGSLSRSIRFRLSAISQKRTNERIVVLAGLHRALQRQCEARGRVFQGRRPALILERHAERLKLLGEIHKQLSERRVQMSNVVKNCLLAAVPSVIMLPQLAALVGVSAAVPVALGLSAAGCVTGLLTSRFDNWCRRAEAGNFLLQGEAFAILAQSLRAESGSVGSSGDSDASSLDA